MSKQTPMMKQYEEIKAANPGFLLFYRMGDFYELFAEHAVTASSILGITLTKRRSSKEGDEGIPMCGVPFHAAEGYISKLLKNGHKVALCEQTETPEEAKKARGSGALVRREVVRLYTGGTLTEESMLKPEENNYLVAIHQAGLDISIGWLDLSTGEFYLTETTMESLPHDLTRLNAKEILITENFGRKNMSTLTPFYHLITHIPTGEFDSTLGENRLKKSFALGTLESLAIPSRAALGVAGALIYYTTATGAGKTPTLTRPRVLQNQSFMQIDVATRSGLELTQTLKGERKGSLIDVLDKTVTSAGSRLLTRWVMEPLQNISTIHERQNAISTFRHFDNIRADLRDILKKSTDISRSVSRLSLERGGPRDLSVLRATLAILPIIKSELHKINDLKSLTVLVNISTALEGFEKLSNLLCNALIEDNLPLLARDGGFIKNGFCEKFDDYKKIASSGMEMLKQLERDEAESTGISSLRIKYNKVWGYFIEVTKSNLDRVPERYIHRQTTTNAQRFSTPELMKLEREYATAEVNMLAREMEIYNELVSAVTSDATKLLLAAEALAELDVVLSGAEIAELYNYVEPIIDTSLTFKINEGRHPVVERTVETYVPNNSLLSDGDIWLITGPNMAGKSTFLRQNAIITLLAHIGFPVPAKEAHIGIVDRIFCRVGAADDLSKGQSTFMMEMVETATILNHATNRSLVILDEIGRGTATYDGLSIAWATAEYLATHNKTRGLFATHYHEMTELEKQYSNIHCYHVTVKEWEEEIIFLHEVKKGAAPGSYGIHVAKLAGLPTSVTARAEKILSRLEKEKSKPTQMEELPLFSSTSTTIEVTKPSEVEDKIMTINIDELTPREAQNMLYELKELSRQN